MELKKFLRIAKKDIFFVLAVGLVIGLVSYFSAPRIQSGFRSQNVFYLSNLEAQSPQGYNFGGYFSQSTAINETDTAVAILSSSDLQNAAANLNASISVRKLAPQVIQITVTSNEAGAPKLAMGDLPKIFNQKMHDLNPNGPAITLSPISDEVSVSYHSINSKLVSAAGFIFGIIFAFLILGLKTYIEV